MNFDFYQEYKNYSNVDLLKIVRRPADYQPAAVTIAAQILSERQVTSEEILSVEQYFLNIENSAKAKQEKVDALKNKANDLLEPILHPGEKVEPGKWVNILLLIIAAQYAWSLINTVKGLIRFLRCEYCSFDITFLIEYLTLLYVPFIFFLLFKRRRWGWILLFSDNLFTLISRVSESYIFFKYQPIHHGATTSFLLPTVIKAIFAFFLWRDPIANHFGVNIETRKKTAVVVSAGTLAFILMLYLTYG